MVPRALHVLANVDPSTPSWMLIRLALETKSHHAGADADRLMLLEDASPERYRAFLEMIYAFESRYEEALIQAPDLDPRIVRARTKVARLRNDLLALGATLAELAALPRPLVPAFRSEAEALGWMYVVERNTLLHGLVRRHLARMMPAVIVRAGSYFGVYGDSPGAKYRDLGLDIDAAARRDIPSRIVDAAHGAFACQRLWFAQARSEATRR